MKLKKGAKIKGRLITKKIYLRGPIEDSLHIKAVFAKYEFHVKLMAKTVQTVK